MLLKHYRIIRTIGYLKSFWIFFCYMSITSRGALLCRFVLSLLFCLGDAEISVNLCYLNYSLCLNVCFDLQSLTLICCCHSLGNLSKSQQCLETSVKSHWLSKSSSMDIDGESFSNVVFEHIYKTLLRSTKNIEN